MRDRVGMFEPAAPLSQLRRALTSISISDTHPCTACHHDSECIRACRSGATLLSARMDAFLVSRIEMASPDFQDMRLPGRLRVNSFQCCKLHILDINPPLFLSDKCLAPEPPPREDIPRSQACDDFQTAVRSYPCSNRTCVHSPRQGFSDRPSTADD
jgi:hypothetical protein